MLKENNARGGFFEREQFEAVLAQLPDYARPPVTFAYVTGWRLKSEILPLQWRQVDFRAGVRWTWARRRTETGRSRGPRIARRSSRLNGRHRRAPEEGHASSRGCSTGEGRPSRVSGRRGERPVWRPGSPGRIPHDFRRTAVRNLERAGVPGPPRWRWWATARRASIGATRSWTR